jgi:hypothetical protein
MCALNEVRGQGFLLLLQGKYWIFLRWGGSTLIIGNVCYLKIVPKCSHMGWTLFQCRVKTFQIQVNLHWFFFFFLTKDRYCYCKGKMTFFEEKVEEDRKKASVQMMETWEWVWWRITMLNLDFMLIGSSWGPGKESTGSHWSWKKTE